MNRKLKKYLDYVVKDLLKQTTAEVYSDSVNYYTPRGIIQRDGDIYMYDDQIANKYGLPDEMEVYNYVDGKYKDILLDLEYDIGYALPKPKRDESIYDFLKRVRKPMNESQDKLDRYHNYIVDDMIKNIDFSVTDAVTKIFVNIKLPFMAPKPILMYFGGVIRWVEPNKSFGKYVMEKYGIEPMKHYGHDIYEWTIVWNLFVSKFLPIAREKVRGLLAPYGY
jgi:hypothetical protein